MRILRFFYCALSLVLCQSTVSADVLYKWQDARGNTQYGDRPPSNVNARPITLPKITIIDNYADQWKPIDFNEVRTDTPIVTKSRASKAYSQLDFLAPKQNQAIRANNGDISTIVSIKPALKEGHLLVFSIDGKSMSKGKSRAKNFSNLSRGSHTIDVKIVDQKDRILKNSSVGFTVLRANIQPN